MNATNLLNAQLTQTIAPIHLLRRMAETQADGCLSISFNSVDWKLYFNRGLLTYASHSLDPFERLERHLRLMSKQVPALTVAVCTEARLKFDNEPQNDAVYPPDYRAIAWLFSERYLNSETAADLIQKLIHEVFETFLLLTKGSHNFTQHEQVSEQLCYINTLLMVKEVEKTIKAWQALAPVISCPNQRPYFFSQNQAADKISVEQQQKLSKLLRGFSFRQIAILVNQDELKIARYLYPLIENKIVILRDPQTPYDRLPNYCQLQPDTAAPPPEIKLNAAPAIDGGDPLGESKNQSQHKIVCVDDSPTILTEINRFLEGHDLSVHALSDSSKALMEIMRIKPDIILLDVGMPSIDGYKLCRLIRNHPLFKHTPIVMVTGNTGIIDRAKARIAGATDYLTKPFTQSELVKMVFRYLT